MVEHARRLTAQPRSYQEFNETGHTEIPKGTEHNQDELMQHNSWEEHRESSVESVRSRGRTPHKTPRKNLKANTKHNSKGSTSGTSSHSTKCITLENKSFERHSQDSEMESSDDQEVQFTVNPNEDDLDEDTGSPLLKINSNALASHTPVLSPTKHNKGKTGETPKKVKQSVATRLELRSPPANTPVFDRDRFLAENRKAEEEMQQASWKLQQVQAEVELAKKRLQAEETK